MLKQVKKDIEAIDFSSISNAKRSLASPIGNLKKLIAELTKILKTLESIRENLDNL